MAYAAVAAVVPSGIWRTLVGVGVDLGWSEEQLRFERIPGFGTAYVIGLTVLSIGAAALTLGLRRRRPPPRRIPRARSHAGPTGG